MKQLPTLENVLQYTNPLVIKRFKQNNPKFAKNAEQLFKEMLKYLWLGQKYEQDSFMRPEDPLLQFIPVMHQEMESIDLMWHEFILITTDYAVFCHDYYGKFIHHVPNMREHIKLDEAQFAVELRLFLKYAEKHLGQETLVFWFKEHCESDKVA